MVTTKTGPNDARRVVWALIGTFFFFVFIEYTVYFSVGEVWFGSV